MSDLSTRKRRFLGLAGLLAAMMLALAACQPASSPVEPAETPTTAQAMQPTSTMAVIPETSGAEAELSVVEDPQLGPILAGNNGMTVYMFTQDEPDKSNCEGGCLANWPPLVTEGSPMLGEGVDPALVGTAELPDGRMIVTYNRMPLYYWANDMNPGDTTGQGVGGVWYVVSPEGEVIGMDEPAAEVTPTVENTPAAEPTATTAPAASASEAEIRVVNDPDLGEILVGSNGMTLYIFTNDEPDQSNCSGSCLENWPPLVSEGSPTLGEGVDPDLVGSADLPDGRKIVTYNRMPLYYWVNDKNPGDTTGQGVGNVWYVISPEGNVIGQ